MIYPKINLSKKISLNTSKNLLWQDDVLYEDNKLKVTKIYPNPANEAAYIDYQVNETTKAKIIIRNILGRVVDEFDLSKVNNQIKINTSSWESGVYFYTLSINGKPQKAKKLIVDHK
jgi:hypothetical protein